MAKLPHLFLENMERLLQEEFPAFLASYEQPRLQGIRANGLKLTSDRLRELSPFSLSPVPWAAGGYYVPETDRPGKHPYYHAGLYYVQEPSAMAPVELLDVRPGDNVLDLCAAPGGKTTQIAAKLQGKGLLVTNDNQPDRVKALVKNVELYGVTNAIVLNETPEKLAVAMPAFFDKILVDAPCSGEGMFRKDEAMVKSWDEGSPRRYAAMQRDILANAAAMLKPGGRLVYSTCTFSPEENERIIAAFLRERPHFRVVPVSPRHGFDSGRPEWADASGERDGCALQTAGTVRLWPYRLRGEGHFAAVLMREDHASALLDAPTPFGEPGSAAANVQGLAASGGRLKRGAGNEVGRDAGLRHDGGTAARGRDGPARRAGIAPQDGTELFRLFAAGQLTRELDGTRTIHMRGDYVYAIPDGAPDLSGLKVARPGWFVGSKHGDRFVPSHALAMGLKRDSDSVRSISFRAEETEAIRYLKGETVEVREERLRLSGPSVPAKGYCLVCVDGYPLGWGKWNGGMLKNEYPPGWRWS